MHLCLLALVLTINNLIQLPILHRHTTVMAKLSVLIILCFVPYLVVAIDPNSSFSKIDLPLGATGPESVAMDPNGEGPYVAINDGRVLKYLGPDLGFVDFAYTSSNR